MHCCLYGEVAQLHLRHYFIFLFRNKIIFMFVSFKQLRLCDTSSPAFEKSLSDGTDEAGTQRNFLARSLSLGKSTECSFHQASGSSSLGIWASSKYLLCSICGPVDGRDAACAVLSALASNMLQYAVFLAFCAGTWFN